MHAELKSFYGKHHNLSVENHSNHIYAYSSISNAVLWTSAPLCAGEWWFN